METALSIERELRRGWGEAAVLHPEAFEQALVAEVLKIDADGKPWRAVMIRGTFGPQVGDNDYYPISCCDGPTGGPGDLSRLERHDPDCRYQRFSLAALDASGGVLTYPPGEQM